MKKIILTLLSLLPMTNLSMAATIRLNDITQEEKIQIIREIIQANPSVEVDEITNESDLDIAINKLIQNGFIVDGAGTKKGSGGESAGVGGI